jgi:hypothetical protein
LQLAPRQVPVANTIAGIVALVALLALPALPEPGNPTAPSSGGAELPLSFVPNAGQADAQVKYAAQGPDFAFHFTEHKAVMSFTEGKRGVALHLTPLAADSRARLEAGDPQPGKVNYLTASARKIGLPTYGTLTYRGVWPGIDMVFRGSGGALKYEFHVAPGADPSRIRLAYRGADGLAVGPAGNLLIGTPLGTVRDSRPRSWQVVDGRRRDVGSRYALAGGNRYGFALGASYDASRPLVIDPGLVYSTFLGGSVTDQGHGIALDTAGSSYLVGQTSSANFPATAGVFDPTHNGQTDVFVAKLNAAGSSFTYTTFLGGGGDDIGRAIAVDPSGNAYVTGTAEPGFPTTAGAFDTVAGNGDAFAAKLSPSGAALLYSTFLGGANSDNGFDIAVDGTGQAHVVGDTLSTAFPTTSGSLSPAPPGLGTNFDGFVSKLNPTASALVYSTFLGGGGGNDTASGIALGTGGAAHVTGRTASTDFLTTAGAFDTSFNAGVADAFAAKLNATGSALDYSTFLGGTGDETLLPAVALDGSGSAYVTGLTASTDYPTTAGAFDPTDNPAADIYVTKLNAAGSAPVYSTYIGGGGADAGLAIAVDAGGSAFVTGSTTSSNYPVSAGAFDTTANGGTTDAFVSRLSPSGSVLTHSTYLGSNVGDTGRAIAVDGSANAHVAGDTVGSAFPVTTGAADTSHNGAADAFAAKLDMTPTPGYVRPAGATPVRVSLVPAFAPCTAPNRQHGAPDLPGGTNPDGSCTPPAHESGFVTIGEPTVNTQQARSVGFVKAKVIVGDGSTPADEADVALSARITDVRNSGTLTDYTGELRAELELRVTDRFNGPTKNDPATGQAVVIPFNLACAATGGTQDAGSNCTATTSADAVTPGAVRESVRSIWEVGSVRVLDGGADGDADTTPNTVFARQGVFVP